MASRRHKADNGKSFLLSPWRFVRLRSIFHLFASLFGALSIKHNELRIRSFNSQLSVLSSQFSPLSSLFSRVQSLLSPTIAFTLAIFLLLPSVLLTLPLTLTSVHAAVNQEITFQGKVVDKTDGTNIAPACYNTGAGNDTCDFRVGIYSASSGGTALWSEILTDVELEDYDSVFTLNVGSYCITNQGGDWTTDGDGVGTRCTVNTGVDWGADDTIYLQVELDTSDTVGENAFSSPETFTRKLITTVPFAFHAEEAATLNGIADTGFVQLQPSSAQTATDTTSLIHLNETGASTPNLLELEVAGTDMFVVQNDGDVQGLRHAAFGADSAIDDGSLLYGSTYSNILSLQEEFTDLSTTTYVEGITNYLLLDPTGAATSYVYGVNTEVFTETGNAQNFTSVDGTYTAVNHRGTGTVSSSYGLYGIVTNTSSGTMSYSSGVSGVIQNTSTGTVTYGAALEAIVQNTNASGTIGEAYGLNVLTTSNSGTITDLYGIYVNNQNSGTNNYALVTNAGNVVFNEGGDASTDFRIEGDTDTDLLFVDASADAVGIGTNSPGGKLEVADSTVNLLINSTAGDYASLNFTNNGSNIWLFDYGTGTTQDFRFYSATQVGSIFYAEDSTGELGFGTDSPDKHVHIADDSNALRLSSADDSSYVDLGGQYGYLNIKPLSASYGATVRSASNDSYYAVVGADNGYASFGYNNVIGTNSLNINSNGQVGIGTTTPDGRLELAGDMSASAWGLNGIQLQSTAATYTDSSTAASGTATNAVFSSYGIPTLAASNASVTTTNAANVYIAGAPTAGTNQTITNAYSLWIDAGVSRFDGGIQLGSDGNDLISQASSGSGASADLYYGNDLVCDVSEANCGWSTGGSSLFTDDTGFTYLTQTADDLVVGGTTLALADIILGDDGTTVFNEQGNDADFRIEGDTDTDLFFADASTDRIGISTNTPGTLLDIVGSQAASLLNIRNNTASGELITLYNHLGGAIYTLNATGGGHPFYAMYAQGTADSIQLNVDGASDSYFDTGGSLVFGATAAASGDVIIDTDGSAVFNEQGNDADFRIEGDTDTNLFFVDASADRVGVGTNSPNYLFEVSDTLSGTGAEILASSSLISSPSAASTSIDSSFRASAYTNSTNLSGSGAGVVGLYPLVQADNASGTVESLFGMLGITENLNVGTVNLAYGTQSEVRNSSTGTINTATVFNSKLSNDSTGTIGTAYGLQVELSANSGTITDTFGVYVGDVTSGTQTNTPYSFYASDANALNYLAGNLGIGTTNPDGLLELAGDITASAWGLNGIQYQSTAATFTDSSTAASGTATNAVFSSYGIPTLAASNASVTTTNAANVYIAGAPTAGTNQTITNAYALWVDGGDTRFDGSLYLGEADATNDIIYFDGGGAYLQWTDADDQFDLSDDLDLRDNTPRLTLQDTSTSEKDYSITADASNFRIEDQDAGDLARLIIDTNGLISLGGASGATAPSGAWLDIAAPTTSYAQINLSPSSAVDKTTPASGDLWWNGTNLYFHNGSSNNDLLTGGGSSLFTDDTGFTYLTQTADDLLVGGTTLALADIILGDDGATVFNEQGNDADFRIEGDTNTNLFFIDASADRVGIGTNTPDGLLELAGDITASAWGLNGIQYQSTAATFTDSSTAASGTATNAVFSSYGIPTLAASNASVTTTNAANVYIAGAPTAGTNQTITNAYALWVDSGDVRIDDDIHLGEAGGIDEYIYFDGGNQSFKWDVISSQFELTNDLEMQSSSPSISLEDSSGGEKDFDIAIDGSTFFIEDEDEVENRLIIDTNGLLGIGGDSGAPTPVGAWLDISAPTTSYAQINLSPSSAVDKTTPASGDLWWNGTNLYFNDGSSDVDLLASGGSSLFTDAVGFAYLTQTGDDLVLGGTTQAGGDVILGDDGATIFNEQGNIVDFRIEGDTDTNLFYVDASAESIGVGVAAPDAWLDIKAATTGSAQLNLTTSGGTDPSTPVSGDLWWNGTNLYFYNGSSNTDLLAGGGSSLFTDGATTTYLTDTAEDFNLGATNTLAAPFSVDVSANLVRIGDGVSDSNNPTLIFYGSDALNSASIFLDDNDELIFSDVTEIGINDSSPDRLLDITGAGDQLRLSYETGDTNYADFGLDASGDLTINVTGTEVNFSDGIDANDHVSIGGGAGAVNTDIVLEVDETLTANSTTGLKLYPTWNFTASASGTLYGQQIRAQADSVNQNGNSIQIRALESEVQIDGGNVDNVFGAYFRIDQNSTGGTIGNAYASRTLIDTASGTSTISNAFGYYAEVDNVGTIGSYTAFRSGDIINGTQTNVYSLWVDEGDIVLDEDGDGSKGGTTGGGDIFLGEGGDAAIWYDGTDLKIDPAVVGTGLVDIDGDLVVELSGTATLNALCHSSSGTTNEQIVDCSGAPSDIAEWYAAELDVQPGDVVELTSKVFTYEAKGSDPDSGQVVDLGSQNINVLGVATSTDRVIGVVSTGPYQTIGEDVKDSIEESGNTSIKAVPLALKGRVPINVSSTSQAIVAGDPLVLGENGKSKKATEAGPIVARALEDWSPSSGKTAVLAFIVSSWYDPGTPTPAPVVDNGGGSTLDNYFAVVDNPGNTLITLSVEEFVVAGALTVEGDLDVLGVITASEVNTSRLRSDAVDFAAGDNGVVGTASIVLGESSVTISNTSVTASSIIQASPDRFVSHRIIDIIDGVGFTIEINEPATEVVNFSYVLFNTY